MGYPSVKVKFENLMIQSLEVLVMGLFNYFVFIFVIKTVLIPSIFIISEPEDKEEKAT